MLQPRFGILKQKRLEHTTPSNMVNIWIRFCFLSIRIFAFDYNEIKTKHFLKIFYCKAGKAKNSAKKFSWTDPVSRIEVISWVISKNSRLSVFSENSKIFEISLTMANYEVEEKFYFYFLRKSLRNMIILLRWRIDDVINGWLTMT